MLEMLLQLVVVLLLLNNVTPTKLIAVLQQKLSKHATVGLCALRCMLLFLPLAAIAFLALLYLRIFGVKSELS